ncbi:MAG: 2-hydroxyacyl-CoA dehydratase [Lachnospiraceae bacterium]|nr:2-hydroxyacyl-CoA dehydratase [Lachnospiraceae bacterium]
MSRLGIDIGSTTVKVVITDENDKILYGEYRRHLANIQSCLSDLLKEALAKLGDLDVNTCITGSGGFSLANALNVNFTQEVIAVSTSLKKLNDKCDVAVELGGEDAKIIYFDGSSVDQRMNGICAGGTGSFIDQMASLLKTDSGGLNEYAKNYKMLYPIAARCGVFAKSDIQPLINEGATKEDLAASIFQAVVNQTISGLACGKPIKGHVAFLGGPLHYLSELRNAFIRTLKLTDDEIINPDNSHLYAAIGCCLCDLRSDAIYSITELIAKLEAGVKLDTEIKRLAPLFNDDKEYEDFKYRHSLATVGKADLKDYEGECFLGIDAGSTTTKFALISKDGKLLHSFYDNNNGSTIDTAKRAIKNLKELLPKGCTITASCSTGYGEQLLKSAFCLDYGEVETIAHYYGATFFNPNVDAILDIGGQDMKYIKIKDGYVDNVLLNEACSSGCGSFIETFAKSLDYQVKEFAKVALFSKNPIDLGTRCTVFMNSNVKQAQKEGANVSDISAGLSYSVIKNALYKVIKITDPNLLGDNIVVQGGTFYNDSVLRALEKVTGRNVVRPDIAGIMGAFGAALIAKERYYLALEKNGSFKSTMLPLDEIINLEYNTTIARCGKCLNNCVLTVNVFKDSNGKFTRRFISGNRCERGLGLEKKENKIPNLFEYKAHRMFDYEPLKVENAPRGIIGIPRVLNMYENFPFWAVFFKELGYSVLLSPISSRKIYEMGIESIPSESECYPAKLVHGHIEWLIENGANFIFMPCVPFERNETPGAQNHYNCPMVTSYAENIKNNVENLHLKQIKFYNPFLPFTDKKSLTDSLIKAIKNPNYFPADITEASINKACDLAWDELVKSREDMKQKGLETLNWIKENKSHGIILAGRPYHVDSEVHHGIPDLIQSYGYAVLTEDSVSHLGKIERPIIVTDQWMYHTRLYACANLVKNRDDLDLIQLNSFGCGLDAVTTDQVSDILSASAKIYTLLKIDEVNNIGAARIRIRSLISAINIRKDKTRVIMPSNYNRVMFTKEMRKTHTILAPNMSPIHFDLLEPALNSCGYKIKILQNNNRNVIDMGLKFVNNDACYPSLIVVGQIMDELINNKSLDLNHIAIMMTQTGGGCRASNYVGFIRRALRKAHMEQIPVVSINYNGMEKNPGLTYNLSLIMKICYSIILGDIFMRVVYATRPYEKNAGETDKLHKEWNAKCVELLTNKKVSLHKFNKLCREIIRSFDNIERIDVKKPKVGIVGEILVKFSSLANNNVVGLLEKEGAEAVMPDLMDFMLYSLYNANFKSKYLGFQTASKVISNLAINFIEYLRSAARKSFKKSKHFTEQAHIRSLAHMAKRYVSIGNQTGEGWFLTGEMLELIESGVPNIVCCQPFGCLPNHIVGKGVIKELKKDFKDANIVAIDYDPGASEVNQLNRIKLMLSTAFTNLKEQK